MNSLWRPPCPCTSRCTNVHAPTAGRLTALRRLILGSAVLLVGAMNLPGRSRSHPWAGRRRGLARALLKALGVRWSVVGAPIARGALLAGNHVSWLDIIVMMAMDDRLRLVAKSEVATWPIIGRMARSNGTIFVDRSRPRSLPGTVAEVAGALRAGHAVQVFPEGTTTCGAHPARWRPAFLQAAIDAGAPVQRFTLIFGTPAAAFVDDESLIYCLKRVLRLRGLSVTVLVDEPQPATAGRRELATRLSPRRLERV